MLISNSKKFIFIHIPKNAGQSITNALFKFCVGKNARFFSDIISTRNYIRINSKLMQLFNFSFYDHSFKDHESASNVKEVLGSSYSSYFSFAFVRNPWDWILSHYTYTLKNVRHYRHSFVKNNLKNFDEYVEYECLKGMPEQYNQNKFIYDSSGNQLVNFVGKFENIQNDFQIICDQLDIDTNIKHFNQSNKFNYREHFSERSKDLVKDYYSKDIELFDYKF
jgi:hypothetical protein